MSSSSRKTILINYKNEDIRIAWYPGTSDAALRDTIREALRIPPDSLLVLTDDHIMVLYMLLINIYLIYYIFMQNFEHYKMNH